ncbi:MAG: hypothetical protein V3U26_05085 [Dehalococcoidia bacterium]
MPEAKLLYFRSEAGMEQGEYVVLSEAGSPDEDFAEPGYTLHSALPLAVLGDMDDWPVELPTNVTLSRNFRR